VVGAEVLTVMSVVPDVVVVVGAGAVEVVVVARDGPGSREAGDTSWRTVVVVVEDSATSPGPVVTVGAAPVEVVTGSPAVPGVCGPLAAVTRTLPCP
jgi:hypothetical protein